MLLSFGFVGYVLLNFFRAAGLKGIAHLWEVMLLRDAVFVDLLQFVPLVVGLHRQCSSCPKCSASA